MVSYFGLKAQSGILYQFLNIKQPSRNHSKHWSPKFKWLRGKKVIKVDLPNFHEKEDELNEEVKKQRMKERGVMPPRPWTERPIILASVRISAIFMK